MGACVETYHVKCKRSELNDEANNLRQQMRYDHGHSGYTGTIAEDNGRVKVAPVKAKDAYEAEEYIAEHAKKWEDSIAVELEDKPDNWIIGGCYSC